MEKFKKTKIVCTIGPATANYDMIYQLAQRGMNIVRFNFSHDTHESHKERMNLVRKVSEDSGFVLSIMVDTKGPEIRVGEIENGEVQFKTGDEVEIYRDQIVGTHKGFSLSAPEVFDDVSAGDTILIDDGKMRLTVLANEKNGVLQARVENFGVIKTRKGVNVPNVHISQAFISEKDDADIRFACRNGADFIAASFVRRKEDIFEIRKILEEENKPRMQIIAKIENQESYENIEEILEAADGVMVARGDLGVEVSTALVPIYQKKIIQKANNHGKPVITATHMLESMMSNPRPTRAEASDVANAIIDGTDAIMTSGETAVGAYPLEAVETMNTIALAMENIIPYRDNLQHQVQTAQTTIQDSIGISVADTSINLEEVEAIVAFTQGGSTARRISKYRPPVPIFAVTFTHEVERSLNANWGVFPVFSDIQNNMHNDDELASIIAKNYGIEPGKFVIITAGYPTGEGTANMMKIIEVK
ncbi:MAG: pyruvate kinase [Erysipelothrix sp.]|nr:pyruvate kinase [Erysipelothrix sp.]